MNRRGQRTDRPISARTTRPRWIVGLALVLALSSGCATVPPEALRLSTVIGEDLTSLQASQRALVRRHFDDLRERANTFLDTRWKPAYLREFISRGDLVKLATAPDPAEAFEGVEDWLDIATSEIEDKRRALIAPIDASEESLLVDVDEAFARVIQANAALTAHLASIVKIQQAQDRTLGDLRLRDLRDRVNAGLIAASESTKVELDRLEVDRERLEGAVRSMSSHHR